MSTSRRVAVACSVLALSLAATACTTSVAGRGRPAAAGGGSGTGSGGASASPSPTGAAVLPSGAPTPGVPRYPDASPEYRSYLNARDATYATSYLTAKGPYTMNDQPLDVDATFGYSGGASYGSCTSTSPGGTAQVIGAKDVTVAKAPATFWSAAGYGADVAAAAADRWATVTDITSVAGVCNNLVFFISQFEPQTSDPLTTGVDGNDYLITNGTTGIVTVVDRATGRITSLRTSRGTIEIGYPQDPPTPPTLPAAGEIVSVPGL